MKITYDKTINAAYISLKNITHSEIFSTETFEIPELIDIGEIFLDFNKNGQLLGFEILSAEALLPSYLLKNKIIESVKSSYDKNSNTVNIQLGTDAVTRTETFEIEGYLKDGSIFLCFNEKKNIVGIKISDADSILPKEFFETSNRNPL